MCSLDTKLLSDEEYSLYTEESALIQLPACNLPQYHSTMNRHTQYMSYW